MSMRFVSSAIRLRRDRRAASSFEYAIMAALLLVGILGTAASFSAHPTCIFNLNTCTFDRVAISL
jgi:Flp pilus assembly pilin Flp